MQSCDKILVSSPTPFSCIFIPLTFLPYNHKSARRIIQTHAEVLNYTHPSSQTSQQLKQPAAGIQHPYSTALCQTKTKKLQAHWLSASAPWSLNSFSLFTLRNVVQQISSCFISGRVGKGGSVKEKASRPAFNPPWPGHVRYDPIKSSSGEGAGLSGSDSDWLVSGSSKDEGDLVWRCGWE